MGKALQLLLLGSIVILSMTNFNIANRLNDARENATDYYARNVSKNICDSMIGMLISTIADSNDFRVETPQSKSLFGGTASYTITNTLLAGMTDSVIHITVNGIFWGDTSTAVANVRMPGSGGFIPAPVKASITTNNPVSTLGNLTVDGRDHDCPAI